MSNKRFIRCPLRKRVLAKIHINTVKGEELLTVVSFRFYCPKCGTQHVENFGNDGY